MAIKSNKNLLKDYKELEEKVKTLPQSKSNISVRDILNEKTSPTSRENITNFKNSEKDLLSKENTNLNKKDNDNDNNISFFSLIKEKIYKNKFFFVFLILAFIFLFKKFIQKKIVDFSCWIINMFYK